MKKWIAALTVVCMVLTTLIAPTAVFAGNESRNVDFRFNGNMEMTTADNGVIVQGNCITLSFDGTSWFYKDEDGESCTKITSLEVDISEGDEAEFLGWQIYTLDNEGGEPELYNEELITDSNILGYSSFPEGGFFVEAVIDSGDGEEDESNIHPDKMILNYTYYDASGECVWQPDMISLIKANDTRMTYGEVIEEAKANAPAAGEHYAGIGGYLKDWKITGTSFGDNYDTTAEAEGGEIYLMADYGGRAIVMTDIAYYDMNKDAVNNSKAVVVERNTYPNGMTYNDVYRLIQEDLPNAGEHGYDFLRWELSEDANAIVKGKDDSLWGTDLTDARFQVYAVYKNCPISFVYKYLNNNVVEEKDVKLVIDGNKTLAELFIENIPESIPSKDIYGWAIDPQITWTNYPSAGTQEITGAAQYKTTSSNDNDGWMSPVFTSRQLIAYDEAANEYYIPDQTEELFYVNVATPDSEDDGQAVKDMESELIKLAGEDVKEFKFQGYEVHYKFIANEKIKVSEVKGDYTIYVGPRYALKAIYNNALVILEYPDGEIDNFPMNIPNPDKAPKLDLPAAYKGKDLLWDKGVAFAGGNAILGGTSEPIESPYTKFTTYEVSMNELTEAPEGLNKTLEEVKNEMRETGFSYKHWKSGEIVYLDVELLRKSGQEEWTEVDDSYFPEKGKVIYLPYPEGTDKNTEFVVSHMITSDYHDGKNKGDVEILSCTNCEQGIRIVVNSLSPIAVAYNGEIGDPAGPVNPDNAADPTESTKPVGAYDTAEPADSDSADEAAQTGDDFNAGLFIAIMIVAFAGIITVLFKRKPIE